MPERHRSPLSLAWIAPLAAAASGGAVLGLELWTAARLAPVYGSGLDVWSAVLSVTFGALAVGYLLGSIQTDRWATSGRTATLFACAALGVLCGSAFVATWLETAARETTTPPLLLTTTLLLAVPMVLLAIAGPWLVELHHRQSEGRAAGRSAGLLYAASTLGGVVCALGAGFHALPLWGLTRTALALALVLAVAALVLAIAALADRRRHAVGTLFLLGLAALLATRGAQTPAEAGRNVIDVRTSLRGRLVVTDDGLHRTLWANGIPQTRIPSADVMHLQPNGLLAAGNALGALPYLRPEATQALVVGLGGGTVARALATRGWNVRAAEIDPQVVALAREHFGYTGHCAVMDGRRYLRTTAHEFDVIVVDVYRGEDLPPHLVTQEFFALLEERLTPRGLLALNLIGGARAPDVAAVLRTVESVFETTALLAPQDAALVPMTLLACSGPLEDDSTQDRLHAAGLALPRRVALDALPETGAPLLCDDRNPIALLRRPTARAWRRAARTGYDAACGEGATP